MPCFVPFSGILFSAKAIWSGPTRKTTAWPAPPFTTWFKPRTAGSGSPPGPASPSMTEPSGRPIPPPKHFRPCPSRSWPSIRMAIYGLGATTQQVSLARFRNGAWETQPPMPAGAGSISPAGLVVIGRPGRETAALGTLAAGVFLLRDGGWTRLRASDGLASDHVLALAADGDAIYAATESGLTVIRDGTADDALNRTYPIFRRGSRPGRGKNTFRKPPLAGRKNLAGPIDRRTSRNPV